MEREKNSFGGDEDQDLLLRSSKAQDFGWLKVEI
jgi:hypothetical protein